MGDVSVAAGQSTRLMQETVASEWTSKALVIVSTAGAIGLEAVLGAREWSSLPILSAAVFAIAFIITRIRQGIGWSLVLFSLCFVPAIFLAGIGRDRMAHQVVGMAGLLGTIVAVTDWRHWSLPPRWKAPLVFWALLVAASWPLIVARECDFTLGLLQVYHIGNSGLGGTPASVSLLVLYLALTYLLGILLFDALFRTFGPGDYRRFVRIVAVPLGLSVLIGAIEAIYQGTVDITWLNGHSWLFFHRASGPLLDGDAFGALAALWATAFFALLGGGGAWLAALSAAGIVASWGGLWATGSRMALLAGLIGLLFVLFYGVRLVWRTPHRRKWLAGAAVGVVALAAIALTLGPRWKSQSPIERTLKSLPSLSAASLGHFVSERLWNRGASYGTSSVLMAEQYPISGVGVGAFVELYPDYSYILSGGRGHFDNAQNWYRQQLAEIGVFGSLGWIIWGLMFLILLVRSGGKGTGFQAGAVKGAIVALALISLVSGPTQNFLVSLTFWVFAFWYLMLIPASAVPGWGGNRGRKPGRRTWLAVWLGLCVFLASTAYTGWYDLRPPYRALQADWQYAYGFYSLEHPPGESPFRWTKREAVDVFPASGAYLKLTFWIHHPDATRHPVEVRIWRKGPSRERLIVDTRLSNTAPVTTYVRVPKDHGQVMLETWVSRTWKPSNYGQKDTRTLGLAVDNWTFVNKPPAGATVIN